MIAKGNPAMELPIFEEFRIAIQSAEGETVDLAALSSEDFKERVRLSYAVFVTGERRTYGNIILRKGTV